MKSNDSPEIPDRVETSDIPGLPSGGIARTGPVKSPNEANFFLLFLVKFSSSPALSLSLPPPSLSLSLKNTNTNCVLRHEPPDLGHTRPALSREAESVSALTCFLLD